MKYEIKKEDYDVYEKVRLSGKLNMLDVTGVSAHSGLIKPVILEIMNRYDELKEKFGEA